jgi:uncharacterized protein YdeI (YjbR/CyaY-like superfamily)
MNPAVDHILEFGCGRCKLYQTPSCKVHKWQKEMVALRNIVNLCGLHEEVKWGQPCYTFNGKNILIIHGFKEYCALLFFNGALLQDSENLLIRQTENVQAGRQMRFTDPDSIYKIENTIKSYIFEAIEVEKAGLKVTPKKTSDFPVPEELTHAFESSTEFKNAFHALTPGRQRAYLLHFAQAKQSETRINRIEKYRDKIYQGKGLND